MSFTFHDDATFEWPVEIHVPIAGNFDTVEITGIFEIVDDVEFLRLDPDVITASDQIDHQVAQVMMAFHGWKAGDVLDKHGAELPATPENIRLFLLKRPNRLAVLDAYMAAITPVKGYRAGN